MNSNCLHRCILPCKNCWKLVSNKSSEYLSRVYREEDEMFVYKQKHLSEKRLSVHFTPELIYWLRREEENKEKTRRKYFVGHLSLTFNLLLWKSLLKLLGGWKFDLWPVLLLKRAFKTFRGWKFETANYRLDPSRWPVWPRLGVTKREDDKYWPLMIIINTDHFK